ncbi:MAG: nicotinate-nucleotide--dimethylbenzimidazole phosphoribosyltransferase [Candidatus Puniceispirillaceae bacterium]
MSESVTINAIFEAPSSLPEAHEASLNSARARQDQLTKPQGSLGRLEEIAVFMASWQNTEKPVISNGYCLVFAGNHGITAKGVSLFPAEVTAQMVMNFEAGGAAINQLCDTAGLSLKVTPLSLDTPTADFSEGPAMSREEVLEAMQIGADALPADADYVCFGEMGIGNTSSAAAIGAAQFGGDASDWTGAGTGLDQAGIAQKAAIINQALSHHGTHFEDTVALLCAYGGRELAAIAGGVLAARARSVPVMLDGFICTAAAATLTASFGMSVLDHCLVSHQSMEPGHHKMTKALGESPLLDMQMRLGEASGAALATLIVKGALSTHNGMATFAEAGVSESDE